MENIRSKYILKYIIFHISEKKKLNLIRYNKCIQTKLNIKLLNYKIVSCNYITIYENDKNGKIYDAYKNMLVFDGEFSNGNKNRRGKEYDNNSGRLIFEEEYLNGKKNGKGKEYYDNEKLKFEGEYHYGKRNGYGKEYTNEGKLLFEGEYKNDLKWNGKGYDSSNNIVYELKEGK